MKAHNLMAVFGAIVASLFIVALIMVLVFTDFFTGMMVPFWILLVFFSGILAMSIAFELRERKRAVPGEITLGEALWDIAKARPFLVIMPIIVTLAVLGILVLLALYNVLIGLAATIVLMTVIAVLPDYKKRQIKTVESYIASKSKRMQTVLWEIHNSIMEVVPTAIHGICGLPAPVYCYSQSDGEGSTTSDTVPPQPLYELIVVQAILGGKTVCVYPINPYVFEVFADKISKYSPRGAGEIHMPIENIDYSLIKDIVLHNKACIMDHVQKTQGMRAPPASL